MKLVHQQDQMDCGPACLLMVLQHYKIKYPLQFIRERCNITKNGVNLKGIIDAANSLGCQSFPYRMDVRDLSKATLPSILHWNNNHFVVLYKIQNNRYYIADPGFGKTSLSFEDFCKSFTKKGILLTILPTEKAFDIQIKAHISKPYKSIVYLYSIFNKESGHLFTILLALLLTNILTLSLPFLMQAIVDMGIRNENKDIIFKVVLAQIFIFLGTTTIDLIRNWATFLLSGKINIQILSNFVKKLLTLPLHFFETKRRGDFLQRISDHERIESFITSQSLVTIFSIFSLIIYLIIIFYYDLYISMIYLALTIISIIWVFYFIKKREGLDYIKFNIKSQSQDSVFEVINGINDIKLNNLESYKLNKWEKVRLELFEINSKVLRLDQTQIGGFNFLNILKNILTTLVASIAVVNGNLTMGELLSISYIIGQLNSPINQIVSFSRSLQDASLSLNRLNDIQSLEPEEKNEKTYSIIPKETDITFNNVSFKYEKTSNKYTVSNINLVLDKNRTTAIVGASGSGKTTLLKLLLGFYTPDVGSIFIGSNILQEYKISEWRNKCGIVLQDGYIFSDTIKQNIICGDSNFSKEKFETAITIANLKEFISVLPLKEETIIGSSGVGISGGQRQRIFIARAVYKNPDFIFFDEATSALDSKNENIIYNNLYHFFKDRTALVIAHRLSTVKNADKILVMKNGKIIEQGTHLFLISRKGEYYSLIKNQLELDES